MYKVDIPLDYKESAIIERRKNAEAARRSRIFDSKSRVIGVDLPALDGQVKQRKEQDNDGKLRNDAFAALMIRNDQTAQLLDKNQDRVRSQINHEIQTFRQSEQRYEDRREFDLNDPNYIKTACPLGQNDHGVSSLQSFIGEDGRSSDRKEMQQEQIREWSLALQTERANAENDKNLQDRMYELKRIELDNTACQLQKLEEAEKCHAVANLKDFNQKLAMEQSLEREARRNEELAENALEIRNQVLGDVLMENPDVSRSAFGPHRVIPDRWKGMSEYQLRNIREEQERQRLENVKKASAAKEKTDQWDLQKTSQNKAGILLEREHLRQQQNLRRQMDAENAALAQLQKADQTKLDQVIYTNVPTDAYYMQFNTSSR